MAVSQSLVLAGLQEALSVSASPLPLQRFRSIAGVATQIGDIARSAEGRNSLSTGHSGGSMLELLIQLLDPEHPNLLGGTLPEQRNDPEVLEALCGAQAAILRTLGNLGIENDQGAEVMFGAGLLRAVRDTWDFWSLPAHRRLLGAASEGFLQLKRNLSGAMGNVVVNNAYSTPIAETWLELGGVRVLQEILDSEFESREEKSGPEEIVAYFGIRALENLAHRPECEAQLATPTTAHAILNTVLHFWDRNETIALEGLGLLRFPATLDLGGFLEHPGALQLCLEILQRQESPEDFERWPEIQRSAVLLGLAIGAAGVEESEQIIPEFLNLLESPFPQVREKAAQCLSIASRAPFALTTLLQPAPLVKLLQLCQGPREPEILSFRYDLFLTLSHLVQTDDAGLIIWKIPGLREFLGRVLIRTADLFLSGEHAQEGAGIGGGDLNESLMWARIAASFVRHFSRIPGLRRKLLDIPSLLGENAKPTPAEEGGAQGDEKKDGGTDGGALLDVLPACLELLQVPHENRGHVLQLHMHLLVTLRTLVGNEASQEDQALHIAAVRLLCRWKSGQRSSAEVASGVIPPPGPGAQADQSSAVIISAEGEETTQAGMQKQKKRQLNILQTLILFYDHPAPHLRYEAGRILARLCGFEREPGVQDALLDAFTPDCPSVLLPLYSLSFGPHMLLLAEAASALRQLSMAKPHILREVLRQACHVGSIATLQKFLEGPAEEPLAGEVDVQTLLDGEDEGKNDNPADDDTEEKEEEGGEEGEEDDGQGRKKRYQILSPPLQRLIRVFSESLATDPTFGRQARASTDESKQDGEAEMEGGAAAEDDVVEQEGDSSSSSTVSTASSSSSSSSVEAGEEDEPDDQETKAPEEDGKASTDRPDPVDSNLQFEALNWSLDALNIFLHEPIRSQLAWTEEDEPDPPQSAEPGVFRGFLTRDEAEAFVEILQGVLEEVNLDADREETVQDNIRSLKSLHKPGGEGEEEES